MTFLDALFSSSYKNVEAECDGYSAAIEWTAFSAGLCAAIVCIV